VPTYRRLFARLGPPENFVMIGNSLKSDIRRWPGWVSRPCTCPYHANWILNTYRPTAGGWAVARLREVLVGGSSGTSPPAPSRGGSHESGFLEKCFGLKILSGPLRRRGPKW
jgi:hypothetical protein